MLLSHYLMAFEAQILSIGIEMKCFWSSRSNGMGEVTIRQYVGSWTPVRAECNYKIRIESEVDGESSEMVQRHIKRSEGRRDRSKQRERQPSLICFRVKSRNKTGGDDPSGQGELIETRT